MTTVLSGNWYASSGQPAPSAALQFTDASGVNNLLTFSVVKSENWDENAEVTEHPVEVGANVADHVRVSLVKCELKVFNTNEPIGQSQQMGSYVDQSARGPLSLPVPVPSWSSGSLTLNYPVWDNPILERAALQAATGAIGNAVGGATGSVIGAAVGGLAGALLLKAHASTKTQGTNAGLENVSQPASPFFVDQWPGHTDYVQNMHTLLVNLKNTAQVFTVLGTKKTLTPMVIETLSFSRTNETGSGEDVTIGLKEIRQVSTQTVTAPIPNLSAGGGKPPAAHGGQDPVPTTSESAVHVAAVAVQSFVGGG